MEIPNGAPAPIHAEYKAMLPAGLPVEHLERQAFYDAVCSPWTTLVVATAETRRFANLLLEVGVVKLEKDERY
jgi:L-fucose mutarotase